MRHLTRATASDWPVRLIAAALAAAAAAIHFAVAPMHFMEASEFGLSMVVAGAAQFTAAILLILWPSRSLVVVTMLGNAVIIGIFAAAYSVGLPFGPDPGKREALDSTVVLSKLIELVLLLVLSLLLSEDEATREVQAA